MWWLFIVALMVGVLGIGAIYWPRNPKDKNGG